MTDPTPLAPFRLSRELSGHTDDVRSICLYPPIEGAFVTASNDCTLKLWTPSSTTSPDYHCETTLVGHAKSVNCVAWFPPPLPPLSAPAMDADHPMGMLCSGSHDHHIIVWDVVLAAPAQVIDAHEAAVYCLATTAPSSPLSPTVSALISGSWDKTARIWIQSDSTFQCAHILKGHEQNVLGVLALSNGDFLTASGDRTIQRWRNGKSIASYVGHADCARGLDEVPGVGFVSSSNDTTLRVWALGDDQSPGPCLQILEGHTNLVYSVRVLPQTGEFVSASEDKTVRVWRFGKCTEILHHPGTVWDVRQLPNGDLVTACSDKVVRIFTRDPNRVASPELLHDFEERLSRQQISTQLIGDVELAKLPGLEALQHPGRRDGDNRIVRNVDHAEVYSWNAIESRWIKIGDVVDNPEGSSLGAGGTLDGKHYDFVFDVQADEPNKSLPKLGFNRGQNPYVAAQQYIWDNHLDQRYLDEIARHIVDNLPADARTGGASFQDPFTGESRYVPQGHQAHQVDNGIDPFTGGGRYVPGSGTQQQQQQQFQQKQKQSKDPSSMAFSTYAQEALRYKQQQQQQQTSSSSEEAPKFPQTTPILFPTAALLEKIVQKIIKLSDEMAAVQDLQQFQLNEDEKRQLNGELMTLLPSQDFATMRFSQDCCSLFDKLLQWPVDKLFPVVDLLRLFVLHDSGAAMFAVPAQRLLTLLDRSFASDSNDTLRSLCLRLLCNSFAQPQHFRPIIVAHTPAILQTIRCVLDSPDPKMRTLYISTLFNISTYYAAAAAAGTVTPEHNSNACRLLSALADTLMREGNIQNVLRLFNSMGNLLVNNKECRLHAESIHIGDALSARRQSADEGVSRTATALQQFLTQ